MQVVRMTEALGLNGGNGYSFHYVRQVLNGDRKNAQISALHQQVMDMRTPPKRTRRKTQSSK